MLQFRVIFSVTSFISVLTPKGTYLLQLHLGPVTGLNMRELEEGNPFPSSLMFRPATDLRCNSNMYVPLGVRTEMNDVTEKIIAKRSFFKP